MKKLLSFYFLLLPVFLSLQAYGQDDGTPIISGKKFSIRSSILNESREILIAAPDNLSQKLPLILVFDGESLFMPVVTAVRFMNYSSEMPQMPEAIVVGIRNTDRDRDMPVPQVFGTGKGEENFKKFIVDELMPYLQKKYPLNGHTITIGHSQGGFFVSYLVANSSKQFPWAVALDAPMTVDDRTKDLKEIFAKTTREKNNKIRYMAVDGLYGWDNEWEQYSHGNGNLQRIVMKDESHESLPFKGIYDGLKFLYRDFAPVRKDHTLAELRLHYHTVSEKYGYSYEIPLQVMLSSAARKRQENRKKEILDLLQYAEGKYGLTPGIARLREDAAKITNEPDPLLDHYLSQPGPTAEEVKKYIGRWTGELVVPRGRNMPMDIEILVEDGKAKLLSVLPWDQTKKEEPLIFYVDKDGRLIFGRRNRGAVLIIATAIIDNKGNLSGLQKWIGAIIPDEAPPEAKEMMQFTINNPNSFNLVRKK
jgi:predicted alpha/beta superfamily hydrolase